MARGQGSFDWAHPEVDPNDTHKALAFWGQAADSPHDEDHNIIWHEYEGFGGWKITYDYAKNVSYCRLPLPMGVTVEDIKVTNTLVVDDNVTVDFMGDNLVGIEYLNGPIDVTVLMRVVAWIARPEGWRT